MVCCVLCGLLLLVLVWGFEWLLEAALGRWVFKRSRVGLSKEVYGGEVWLGALREALGA